jgi:short-subunit dehydrogenase
MLGLVLITGASGGIGLEFARLFASKGFSLVLVARSSDKLQEIKKDLEDKYNISVEVISKDLASTHSAIELHEEIKYKGLVIDILINNAGFGDSGLFYETDTDRDIEMINLNMTSLYVLTKLFVQDMLKRNEGRILNVSSVASFMPGPYMSLYYATKAFVTSFSLGIAKELKNTGVYITVLCPGPTKSDFFINANAKGKKITEMFIMPEAREVAKTGYIALKKGKKIVVHGLSNRLMVFLIRFLPVSVINNVVALIQKS